MTENKQPREQMALHTYRRQAEVPVNRREPLSDRDDVRDTPRRLQRVVTVPESDPFVAWNTFAQRQEQIRRERARPQRYVKPVARTLAQTGVRATGERYKAISRSLPQYHTKPVPTRSGRNAARRGFLWKILGMLIVIVAIILAAGFVFTSNAFRIEQVNVMGTRNNVLIRNIQRMGMQGQNIFLLDVQGLQSRVDVYPSVASASLSKQWPNQVTVTVVERTPVLLWQTQQGIYSVDSQGMVIAPASETTGTDQLMTVVDMHSQGKGQPIHSGDRLRAADIAFAVDVFNRLPKVVGNTAFTLGYDGTMYLNVAQPGGTQSRSGSYIIKSAAGWKAYLGNADDANSLDNRLIELQSILALAQQQQLNLATVDLRYGLHPVYTLK